MDILFLYLSLDFLAFLFCLYSLARDDFVLLRKNVTLPKAFNMVFLMLVVSFLFSRVLYVVFHFDPKFLNPLSFLLFPYVAGLSLPGGVLGGVLFVFFYSKTYKFPSTRIFDLFALSFLCALWFDRTAPFFVNVILTQTLLLQSLIEPITYGVVFCLLVWLFIQEKLKDATAGIVSLLTFSSVSFLANVIINREGKILFFTSENILLFCMVLLLLAILVRQERMLRIFQRFRS